MERKTKKKDNGRYETIRNMPSEYSRYELIQYIGMLEDMIEECQRKGKIIIQSPTMSDYL